MAINILRFIIPKSLVQYIEADSTIRQAIEKMSYHRYTAIPVIDGEGTYLGTLKNADLLTYILNNNSFTLYDAEEHNVTEIMDHRKTKPLSHGASMEELVECVKEHNSVPIVDDRGCFIGIILRRDVLNYLLKFYKDE